MSKENDTIGYHFPTWTECRQKLREWGVEMVARDFTTFFGKIRVEKRITEQLLEKSLHPFVDACIKYSREIEEKRLTMKHAIYVIKSDFPNFIDLEIFQEESFKNEIKRGINDRLGEEESLKFDLDPLALLPLIPILFPENTKQIYNFFIDNLPILEDKYMIDDFDGFYSEISEYFEVTGLEKEVMMVKDKIQPKDPKLVEAETEEFYAILEGKSNPERELSGKELRVFPENVEDIEEKSKNYDVRRTFFEDKNEIESKYCNSPQFGDYIVDYGVYLLEHDNLVEAGKILSCANGSENFDNMWPFALFHKARIAAILEEFDYMIEFLRRSFRAAAAHEDVCGGQEYPKKMAESYYEFRRYRSHPRFKEVLAHNFNNKKDIDEYWATGWY